MPSPRQSLEVQPRPRARRGACLAVAALLACAAPAAAQEDPSLDPGGASPEPTATATPAPTGTATPETEPAPAVRTLRRGSRGREVKRLQRKLRITADGAYGRQTARAVRRFQRRKGIRANGVAGPSTLRALGLAPAAAKPASESGSVLERIADCESGGDPTAVSRSGQYRGKYQFDRPTWRSVGGTGDPAAAPEAEQDERAAQLYAERGIKPWPVCGPKATGDSAS